VQRRLRRFLASKTHPTPVSRILGQQTLQHQPSGSSASKRQRKSRASLSCKQAAYQDPRQGSVILRQQTSWSVDLQDHVAANDFQRQPPRSSASKRPAGPRSSASKRPSAATSRILGQHTTFSANLEDSRQANDVQRRLRGVLASKTTSSANLEDPRPANPSAPTPRILGKQTTAPTQRILVPQTSISGNFSHRQTSSAECQPSAHLACVWKSCL
jgi:hypothetical protein